MSNTFIVVFPRPLDFWSKQASTFGSEIWLDAVALKGLNTFKNFIYKSHCSFVIKNEIS